MSSLKEIYEENFLLIAFAILIFWDWRKLSTKVKLEFTQNTDCQIDIFSLDFLSKVHLGGGLGHSDK